MTPALTGLSQDNTMQKHGTDSVSDTPTQRRLDLY